MVASTRMTFGDMQVVSRIPVFRGLRKETVEQIIASASTRMLRPRETLVRQDDPATAFFIVIDGWLKLYRSVASGGDTVISMLKGGDSFGESISLSGGRYMAGAEAATEARIARIPADFVVRCIRQNPEIGLAMIASASVTLDSLIQQVEELKAHSGIQRVADFIASLATAETGACVVVLPYDKVIVASRLGLTPEYLSRAFAKLRSIGVNVTAERVSVRDIERLRRLAGEDRIAIRGAA
jgi:CRP-like cAMP-binding protein